MLYNDQQKKAKENKLFSLNRPETCELRYIEMFSALHEIVWVLPCFITIARLQIAISEKLVVTLNDKKAQRSVFYVLAGAWRRLH